MRSGQGSGDWAGVGGLGRGRRQGRDLGTEQRVETGQRSGDWAGFWGLCRGRGTGLGFGDRAEVGDRALGSVRGTGQGSGLVQGSVTWLAGMREEDKVDRAGGSL